MLSFTGKRWHIPQTIVPGETVLEALYRQRGLAAEQGSVPASIYPDGEKAVARIRSALKDQERLTVFGDYDCDGITGAAQLLRFFRRSGHKHGRVRLPHREKDGYGLNMRVVEECKADGTTLMITVDTGISAVEEIAALREAGVDVIVLDHHHVGATIPNATAILHPQLAPGHPLPHPSGAGVAYQLLRLLHEGDTWEDCETDTALAAIGTVADLVPLTGGNRHLTRAGLAALSGLQSGALFSLMQNAELLGKRLTSTDIAFRLAPRINAAGRMADPTLALRALTEGGEYITTLNNLNRDRQDITRTLVEEVTTRCAHTNAPLLADASETYPPGVIGLIAGKLTERFGKPSAIGNMHDGLCTVSLRSPPCYHIAEGLDRLHDLLLRYGGHAQAAGCTLASEKWPEFVEALTADIAERTTPDELVPTLHIDAVLENTNLQLGLVEALQELEPYGQGNTEPLFLLPGAKLESARAVGSDGSHLQARIGDAKVIGFGLAELLPHTEAPLDLVCRLGIDTWQNRANVQLHLVDARLSV